jgi:uncharacterized membrane protein
VTAERPTPVRRAAPAAAVGVLLFLAACFVPRIGIYTGDQVEDVRLFQTFGERFLAGEIPYRDFFLEYPPGALTSFVIPALAATEDFTLAFKLLHIVFGCALVACVSLTLALLDASRARLYAATALAAATPLILGPTVLNRYDLWPALLTAAGLAALIGGRAVLGPALLGLATVAKGYAIVLLPLALVYVWQRRGREEAKRALIAYGAAVTVVLLPFAMLGPGGLKHSVWIQLRRGLHIESLAGSVLAAADRLGIYTAHVFNGFAIELTGTLPSLAAAASTLLQIAALGAVWVVFARGEPTRQRVITASAAAVTAFVVFGKVLSPQFVIWLIPLVALVPGYAPAALVVAAAALTRGFFPERYSGVTHIQRETWFVLSRNVALVVLFAILLRLLARERVDPEAASAADT